MVGKSATNIWKEVGHSKSPLNSMSFRAVRHCLGTWLAWETSRSGGAWSEVVGGGGGWKEGRGQGHSVT